MRIGEILTQGFRRRFTTRYRWRYVILRTCIIQSNTFARLTNRSSLSLVACACISLPLLVYPLYSCWLIPCNIQRKLPQASVAMVLLLSTGHTKLNLSHISHRRVMLSYSFKMKVLFKLSSMRVSMRMKNCTCVYQVPPSKINRYKFVRGGLVMLILYSMHQCHWILGRQSLSVVFHVLSKLVSYLLLIEWIFVSNNLSFLLSLSPSVELATIMDRLYGGVCYAGIDTDPELKYPKGAGRVAFSNQQSYIAAISARFVQLQHGEIEKRVSHLWQDASFSCYNNTLVLLFLDSFQVEVKPYVLDDQICDECQGGRCGGKFAPFFCANVTCLQYYCEHCWATIHSRPGREFHKPLVKEGADRPRAVFFRAVVDVWYLIV